jgi:hypothetical protein
VKKFRLEPHKSAATGCTRIQQISPAQMQLKTIQPKSLHSIYIYEHVADRDWSNWLLSRRSEPKFLGVSWANKTSSSSNLWLPPDFACATIFSDQD